MEIRAEELKSTDTCGSVNFLWLKSSHFTPSDKSSAVRALLFLNRSLLGPPQRHMLSVKESMKAL